MKKIVMLFLATAVLAGASFAGAQATSKTDNAMASDAKSDTMAPKKTKKAKKAKAAKTKKAKKDKSAMSDAPAATPAK